MATNKLMQLAQTAAQRNRKKLDEEKRKAETSGKKNAAVSASTNKQRTSNKYDPGAKIKTSPYIDALVTGSKDAAVQYVGDINLKQSNKNAGTMRTPGSGRRHGYEPTKTSKDTLKKVHTQHQEQAKETVKKTGDIVNKDTQKLESYKNGMGAVGKMAVDTAYAAGSMLTDIAVGTALTGGAGGAIGGMSKAARLASEIVGRGGITKAVASSRAEVQEYNKAIQEGASDTEARMAGLSVAALEYLTESMFGVGGAIKSTMGKGFIDIEKVLKMGTKDIIKSPGGREMVQALQRFGLTAGTEGAEEFVSGVVQPLLEKVIYSDEELDWGEIIKSSFYQAGIGAILGGGFGVVDVAGAIKSGQQLNDADTVKTLIDEGMASKESSGAYKLAKRVATQMRAGVQPTSFELHKLQRENQAAIQDEQNEEAKAKKITDKVISKQTGKTISEDADLQDQLFYYAEAVNAGLDVAVPYVVKEYHKTMQDIESIMKTKIDTDPETGSTAMGDIISMSKIVMGRGTTSDMIKLNPSNTVAREVFEEYTGQTLPDSNEETRKFVLNYNENRRIILAKTENEPGAVEAREEGYAAYRRAGELGVGKEEVGKQYGKILDEQEQNRAYESGVKQAVTQKETKGKVTEPKTKKNRSTVATKSATGFTDKTTGKTGTPKAKELDKIAKFMGIKIELVDEISADVKGRKQIANGVYKNGVITISKDAANPLAVVFSHELWHHLKSTTESATALEEFVKREMFKNDPKEFGRKMDQMKALYKNNDEQWVFEEIMADSLHEIMGSHELWTKLSENKSLAQKILDFIKEFVDSLRSLFADVPTSDLYDMLGIKEEVVTQLAAIINESRESNQPSKENTKAEKNVPGRFSMSEPVETKGGLIAVHNLGEESLKEALNLGGLPMPSIAITKPEVGHTAFGPISLIFSKDTINPTAKQNKVYSGDAYTPTFPSMVYKYNSELKNRLEKHYNLPSNFLEQYLDTYNDASRTSPKELARYIKNNEKVVTADTEEEITDFIVSDKSFEKGIRNRKTVYTASGNRRSFNAITAEYNLDNIVKIMKSDIETGGTFINGIGSFRGAASKEYVNINHIKGEAHKIKKVDRPEYDSIRNQLMDDMMLIAMKIAKHDGGLNDALSVMTEAIRKDPSINGIQKYISSWPDVFNSSEQIAVDIYNLYHKVGALPTEYFEAKPRRAVSLDEIQLVVLPQTTSQTLIDELKSRNIPVDFYDPEKEGSRIDVVNSHEEVRWSLQDANGKALTKEQADFFKDSKVRDEQGRLQRVYHGSNSEFTIFDRKNGGQSNSNAGVGFWFTPNKQGAETFAKESWWGDNKPSLYETYLNIKNPKIYTTVDRSDQVQAKYNELVSLNNEMQALSRKYYWLSLQNISNQSREDLLRIFHIKELEVDDVMAASKKYVDLQAKYKAISKEQDELRYGDAYEQFRKDIYAMVGKTNEDANVGGLGMHLDNKDEALNLYRDNLMSQGYDGIVINGTRFDEYAFGENNVQYVAFDSNQIKSIDNKKPTNDEDIRYSLDTSYSDQVDMTLNGELPKTTAVYVSQTPKILMGIGMKQLPMLITQSHIRNIVAPKDINDTTKHGLTVEQIKKLPELISDPVMVMDSLTRNDSVVVVTSEIDEDNMPVVVSVLPNGNGTMGIERVDSNFITSIYGKDSFRRFIEKNMYAETMLFIDNEKSHKLFNGIRVQFPQRLNNYDFDIIIKQSENIVNTNFESDDERFSLQTVAQTERAYLKKKIEEMQTALAEEKLTEKGLMPNKDALTRLQYRLRQEYNSQIKVSELTSGLTELYGMIKGQNDIDGAADLAVQLAKDIISQGGELNTATQKDYFALKAYMKKTPIKIDEEYRGDFGKGDWNRFRKSMFGKLNLSDSGKGIDTLYKDEILPLFSGHLNSELTHPTEILNHILEVMDSLEPVFTNFDTRSYVGQEMVDMVTLDILDSMFEMSPQKVISPNVRRKRYESILSKIDKATDEFAKMTEDKRQEQKAMYERMIEDLEKADAATRLERKQIANRYAELTKQMVEERKEYLKLIKLTGDERVKQEAALWKAKMEAYKGKTKERMSKRQTLAKINDHAAYLSEMLISPSDKKHIPEGYRRAIASVLVGLNFESTRTDAWEKRMGKPGKRVLNFRNLAAEYNRIIAKEDDSFMEIDSSMADMIQLMANTIDDMRLSELNDDQLRNVLMVMKHLRHVVSTTNRAFNENIKEDLSTLGESIIKEMSGSKAKRERDGIRGSFDRFFQEQVLAPADFFAIVGGTTERLYAEVRDGFDTHVNNVTEAMNYIDKAMEGVNVKDVRSWAEKHGTSKKYKLSDGTEIEMLPSQVMSLYALMRRKQARDHVLGSGIVIAPISAKEDKSGFSKKLMSTFTRLSYEDVMQITGSLSDEQRTLANKLLKFISTTTSDWGNETSMKLYGYKKFTEEFYFPIKSADVFLDSQFDKTGMTTKIKNLGFTKNTIVNANNPIVIDDFFNVITDHITKMSMYNALVPALTDFERVYNYKQRAGDSTVTESVQNSIVRTLGLKGKTYIDQMMRDINGNTRKEFGIEWAEKMLSGFKKASLGLNLRVLVQQPTSLFRAAMVIDHVYLLEGMATKFTGEATRKEMWEHIPTARWKSWGYAQTDVSREQRDIMLGINNVMDTVTMGMYGWADDISWTVLYGAVKAETKVKHSELEQGTQEYWDHVRKRFNQIVDRTQVVDSVFHRVDIMRDKTFFKKMLTSFMPEPLKLYNMINTQLILMKKYIAAGDTEAAAKAGLRIATSLVPYFTILTVVQSVMDTIRRSWTGGDDDDDKSYWELFKTHFWDNLIDNVNPVTMLPFFRDMWSYIRGYDVKRPDLIAIEKMADDFKMAAKYFDNWQEGKVQTHPWSYIARKFGEDAAMFFGVPVKNVLRETESITFSVMSFVGYKQYSIYLKNKLKTNILSDKGMFIDLWIKAEMNGDPDDAQMIYDDLMKSGITRDDINKRIKATFGKEFRTALEDERFIAAQNAVDKMLSAGVPKDELVKSVSNSISEVYKAAFEEGDTDAMEKSEKILRKVGFTDADISNYQYGYARGLAKLEVYQVLNSDGESAAYQKANEWLDNYPDLYESADSLMYAIERSADTTKADWDEGEWRKSTYDKFE